MDAATSTAMLMALGEAVGEVKRLVPPPAVTDAFKECDRCDR